MKKKKKKKIVKRGMCVREFTWVNITQSPLWSVDIFPKVHIVPQKGIVYSLDCVGSNEPSHGQAFSASHCAHWANI